MTTTVRHYRNSFLDIQNDEIRILMDPWVHSANEGAWAASKNGNNFILNTVINRHVDYIYISHLHTDHFDLKFLENLKKKQNKKFKIIIKKFKDNRLKNQILKNGFKTNDIIDVDAYEILKLKKNSKLIILPQISSSNTPNEYINYDLDTSCIFKDNNICFFNQVDNPYSTNDIKTLLTKLKNKIDLTFNLAFVPYCAASEFPQAFININKNVAKKKIINERISKFTNIGKILKCEIIIPAGGSYKLDNIFSRLNKYCAVPNFNTIKRLFKKKIKKNIEIINTELFYFEANKYKISLKENSYNNNFKSKINFNSKNLSYNKTKIKFSKIKIKQILKRLENKMPEFKKNLYDKTKSKVIFKIWNKQPILLKNLKTNKNLVEHEIKFKNLSKKNELVIHIYYKLFLSIINRLISWNETQNHCLYERKPNKYEPDIVFWLNLYKF